MKYGYDTYGSQGIRSLLSWERGLKYNIDNMLGTIRRSLLSWERGLKYRKGWIVLRPKSVAPLVGAWIEIIIVALITGGLSCRSSRGSVD